MADALIAGLGAGLAYIGCVLCCRGVEYCQKKKGIEAHQQDDIFNISSRVQGQEQWPTHDAHLSIDHISIMNQMNKPVYDDAPPSYEEATKTINMNGEGPMPIQVVVEGPKSTMTTSSQQ